MPNALRTMRPIARGIVMLGRKPGPNVPPAVLKPKLLPDRAVDHDQRGGSAGGLEAAAAGGPFAHQRLERGQHDREVLGLAARHRGVDRRQVDLQSRPTCSSEPMISPGSLSVVARNWSTSGFEAWTSGSPPDQPCS